MTLLHLKLAGDTARAFETLEQEVGERRGLEVGHAELMRMMLAQFDPETLHNDT